MNKFKQSLFAGVLALLTLFPVSLLSALPAQAQQYSDRNDYPPRIAGFNVDEVRRLRPGTELSFDLYGTPGGTATLRIAGARRNLSMTEVEPGQYQGSYTIGARDRISANSAVTANLRVANRVTTGVLSESLVRGVGYHAPSRPAVASRVLRIERFDVVGNDDLAAGNELEFTVLGTPDAKVEMTIDGARGVFFLPEVRPGEYAGNYVIRRRDNITSTSRVTARLRHGDQVALAILGKPLQIAARSPRVVRYCTNCATVQAVNLVTVAGDGNYLGTVGGGVAGALLGNQVGSGSGRTAATVAGALGGAYAGRELERNSRRTQHYEVQIRYTNGATQTLSYANDPGYRVGDKVKVNDGVLARDE